MNLQSALIEHRKWLHDPKNGRQLDLSGEKFTGINLPGVNLTRAILRNVDLRGANLVNTNFSHTTLQGADLRGANCLEAIFISTDLRHAKMSNINLIGADLRGADLRGAIDAPLLFRIGKWAIQIRNGTITVGCQSFSIEQWECFTENEIIKMDPEALYFWELWKEPLLSMARAQGKYYNIAL